MSVSLSPIGATSVTFRPAAAPPASPPPPAFQPASGDAFEAQPDPLVHRAANGVSFAALNLGPLADAASKALAAGADVPGRIQDGPTCGLYALGMVMDFWDRRNARNLNPLVLAADVNRPGSHTRAPDTRQRLFDVAAARGYTQKGEMFWSDNLAKLAKAFGYRARVVPNVTLSDIHACLDRGNPALIPFDVDKQGNPGLFNGARAHWAVIEGHFRKDGQEYLVATHGWTGKEYVWRANDLMKSVNQVNEADFPGVPRDITGTLRGRMVEVIPG